MSWLKFAEDPSGRGVENRLKRVTGGGWESDWETSATVIQVRRAARSRLLTVAAVRRVVRSDWT